MSTTKTKIICNLVDAWKHMDDVEYGNIPDGREEQTVFYFPAHKSMVEYEARQVSHLIAAAPRMLAALELVIAVLDNHGIQTGGVEAFAYENAVKAIQKARGNQ